MRSVSKISGSRVEGRANASVKGVTVDMQCVKIKDARRRV